MILQIIKYAIILTGIVLAVIGVTKDLDILTIFGAALVVLPFFIFPRVKNQSNNP